MGPDCWTRLGNQCWTFAHCYWENGGIWAGWMAICMECCKTISLWTLGHAYFRDAGKTEIETYYCPLKDQCRCPVQIRFSRNVTSVTLKISCWKKTQARCYQTYKTKKLNFKQRIAVVNVVIVNPTATSSDVGLALRRLSPSGVVKPGLAHSLRFLVKIQKKKSFWARAGGAVVTNSFSSIAVLSKHVWFGDIIAKHNSGKKHFSNQHEVFCISNISPEAAGEEIFLNLATVVWSILNLGLGLASGWPNCLCIDGTGKVSKY